MGQHAQLQEVLGLRRDSTPIALSLGISHPIVSRLLELARARQWQLINLESFDGVLPAGMVFKGALVDKLPTERLVSELIRLGIPTVRLGNWPHPNDHRVPAVMSDRVMHGTMAADHFAQRAFQHVAIVGHDPWAMNLPIYEAFARRAGELGITCHLLQHKAQPDKPGKSAPRGRWEHPKREFKDWLAGLPLPVGLFIPGSLMADRYSRWVAQIGLRIPEDVGMLCSGDDAIVCQCASVPMSAIADDVPCIVRTAVDTLSQLMEGRPLEQTTIRIPPRGIVTRQSTDVLATTNPHVARALRFMWEHVNENLSVDQIADHTGVSRRSLQRAFTSALGRGISQELKRRRLERARELLTVTDLRIARIAELLGFSSQKYFCEAFHAANGISPTGFRQNQQSPEPEG